MSMQYQFLARSYIESQLRTISKTASLSILSKAET